MIHTLLGIPNTLAGALAELQAPIVEVTATKHHYTHLTTRWPGKTSRNMGLSRKFGVHGIGLPPPSGGVLASLAFQVELSPQLSFHTQW